MARTLLITGTLAPRALRERLASEEARDMVVVESDTLLNRARYPKVSTWRHLSDLIPTDEALAINTTAENEVDAFLSQERPSADLPTHRGFRAACLGPHTWRLMMPHLFNQRLAEHCLQQFQPTRIIVAAGSGVHFQAWKEAAGKAAIPIEFLPPEKFFMGVRRRLWKWWQRWTKPAPTLLSSQPLPETSATTGYILCTSERLSRLIAGQTQQLNLPVQAITAADLEASSPALHKKLTQDYQQWWQNWLGESGHNLSSAIQNIGKYYVEKIYPTYACIYYQALQHLKTERPVFMLSDTQTGTKERMWSLAAQELDIPVVAYNYDQMPTPRFSYLPEFILANSRRSVITALHNGVPEERLQIIQSHRKQHLGLSDQRPNNKRPLIVYADGYNAGMRADILHSSGYRFYQTVIGAARKLPQYDFIIKFHPLRERKQAQLSFVAMDESELRVRKDFIHEQKPPANLRLISPEENLPQIMARTDVLLNFNSTSGVDAFEMKIPVIFLQQLNANVKVYPNIHDYQACIHAEDPDTLAEKITTLIQQPEARALQIQRQQRYIEDFYWPPGPSLVQAIETCSQQILAGKR